MKKKLGYIAIATALVLALAGGSMAVAMGWFTRVQVGGEITTGEMGLEWLDLSQSGNVTRVDVVIEPVGGFPTDSVLVTISNAYEGLVVVFDCALENTGTLAGDIVSSGNGTVVTVALSGFDDIILPGGTDSGQLTVTLTDVEGAISYPWELLVDLELAE